MLGSDVFLLIQQL